ncbi:MAG: hypothetical protein PHP37_02300 [Patescibacteria group bacterium]|nr:hypothetical protein [Patescibacteria group bacterium]
MTILNVTFDFFLKKGWLNEALKSAQSEIKSSERERKIRLVAKEYNKRGLFKEAQKTLTLLPPEKRKEFPWTKAV